MKQIEITSTIIYVFINKKFLIIFFSFIRFIYPDFLPNPVYYFRDKIREKLERIDMINRRKQINIPEFYVGMLNFNFEPKIIDFFFIIENL